jgi:hypothetical protein
MTNREHEYELEQENKALRFQLEQAHAHINRLIETIAELEGSNHIVR